MARPLPCGVAAHFRYASGRKAAKMTYNFDPDRWYDDERGLLDTRHRFGEISAQKYKEALADLDRRYDEMLQRLNGTYQIPKQPPKEK